MSALYSSNWQSRQALLQYLPYHLPGKVSLPNTGLLQALHRAGIQSVLSLRLPLWISLPASTQSYQASASNTATLTPSPRRSLYYSSPQLVRREAHQAPESHKKPLLYHVMPQHLISDIYTAGHPSSLLFCSPSSAACRSQSRGEASYIRKGGEDVPKLPRPIYANVPIVTDPTHSLLCHPMAPQHHKKKLHRSD